MKTPQPAHPTLKSIAVAAGLSVSSVSRALKQHPGIPEATRLRVAKIAEELGYRPDARLSQLMTHLRKDHASRPTCNLAWLSTWDKPGEWSQPWNRDYLIGAKERAADMGYTLDELNCEELRAQPKRINQILKSRGIEGLVLPQFLENHSIAKTLDWSAFATVYIDEYSPTLAGSRASTHYLANAQLALRRIHELGYRRPALWISEFIDDRSVHAYSSAILWAQWRYFPPPHPPLLLLDGNGDLSDYLARHRPDLLIVQTNSMLPFLHEHGFRVPEDIGVVHLNLASDVEGWAGIDQKHHLVGTSAIDSLIGQLHRREFGVRNSDKHTLIPGEWRDGFTVRSQIR